MRRRAGLLWLGKTNVLFEARDATALFQLEDVTRDARPCGVPAGLSRGGVRWIHRGPRSHWRGPRSRIDLRANAARRHRSCG